MPEENIFWYAVTCHGHNIPGEKTCGRVPLTKEQYNKQMSNPDSFWYCPQCGGSADFSGDIENG